MSPDGRRVTEMEDGEEGGDADTGKGQREAEDDGRGRRG